MICKSQPCLNRVCMLTVHPMKGATTGLMLISTENHRIHCTLRFGLKASNNKAEYKALIAGLHLVKEMQIDAIEILVTRRWLSARLLKNIKLVEIVPDKIILEEHIIKVCTVELTFKIFILKLYFHNQYYLKDRESCIYQIIKIRNKSRIAFQSLAL